VDLHDAADDDRVRLGMPRPHWPLVTGGVGLYMHDLYLLSFW
jgi:hypothetical protein